MTPLPTIQPSRDFIIEPVYQTPTELTAGMLQVLQRVAIPLLGTADPTLADLVGFLIHLQREHGEQASLEDTIQVYVGRVLAEQYASRRLRTTREQEVA
jgi:hypothetical protein